MTDYNDGKWHGWNGGECPVHIRSKVRVLWQDADGSLRLPSQGIAGNIAFLGNEHGKVVAFCVTKEHREPREVWFREDRPGLWEQYDDYVHGAVKFREVLE